MPRQSLPRNTFGRFRSYSQAIEDIIFEPSSEIDFDNFLGNGSMTVIFNERGTYRYEDVNYIEYVNFKNAPSWGEYFNNFIRPYYDNYERIG